MKMPVEMEAGGATIFATAVMYEVVLGASKYILRLTPTRRSGRVGVFIACGMIGERKNRVGIWSMEGRAIVD